MDRNTGSPTEDLRGGIRVEGRPGVTLQQERNIMVYQKENCQGVTADRERQDDEHTLLKEPPKEPRSVP